MQQIDKSQWRSDGDSVMSWGPTGKETILLFAPTGGWERSSGSFMGGQLHVTVSTEGIPRL